MGKIEREIKILNVDVKKVKDKLRQEGINQKWAYIQDVYTFDLPSVDELYIKAIELLETKNDKRNIEKLISDIKPCFTHDDILLIKEILGVDDFLLFIKQHDNYKLLHDKKLIELMKNTDKNYSKWVRLRRTGDETTITIKKIVDSTGEYAIDNVDELEFDVPDIEFGKEFLSDLGYFFDRHQIKMRIAYDYKNTEIVIDKWPLLKPYIEVEGPTEEEILEAVSKIGYASDDVLVINTDDVYMKNGINIYDEKYSDLSFDEKEEKEVEEYLNY